MKKLTGILNIACCLFLLTGCGSDSDNDSTKTTTSEDPVRIKAAALIDDQGDAFTDQNFIDCIVDKIVSEYYDDNNDITDLSELSILECDDLSIENVNGVQLLTGLTRLKLNGNNITTIDLSYNTALTDLGINNNLLTEIDISALTDLTYLNLSDNDLTDIDVTNNMNLTGLDVSGNQLTSISLPCHDDVTPSKLRDLSIDNPARFTVYDALMEAYKSSCTL